MARSNDIKPHLPPMNSKTQHHVGSCETKLYQCLPSMQIPKFPTTTIGSFPQTKEIRKVRADFKAGRITEKEHDDQMDQFMKEVIGVQVRIASLFLNLFQM